MPLADVAYTLQVARDAMEHRLAFVAGDRSEALKRLDAFLAGDEAGGLHLGRMRANRAVISVLEAMPISGRRQPALSRAGRHDELLALWVRGLDVTGPSFPAAPAQARAASGLSFRPHAPLGARQRRRAGKVRKPAARWERGFLRDHLVGGRKVLPGVVQFEQVRASWNDAGLRACRWNSPGHVWSRPVAVDGAPVRLEVELGEAGDSYRILTFGVRAGRCMARAAFAPRRMSCCRRSISTRCAAACREWSIRPSLCAVRGAGSWLRACPPTDHQSGDRRGARACAAGASGGSDGRHGLASVHAGRRAAVSAGAVHGRRGRARRSLCAAPSRRDRSDGARHVGGRRTGRGDAYRAPVRRDRSCSCAFRGIFRPHGQSAAGWSVVGGGGAFRAAGRGICCGSRPRDRNRRARPGSRSFRSRHGDGARRIRFRFHHDDRLCIRHQRRARPLADTGGFLRVRNAGAPCAACRGSGRGRFRCSAGSCRSAARCCGSAARGRRAASCRRRRLCRGRSGRHRRLELRLPDGAQRRCLLAEPR